MDYIAAIKEKPKLIPCPFCGCSADIWRSVTELKEHVVCNGCGVSTGYAEGIDEAAKLWNRRMQQSPEEFAEDMKKCTDSDPEYSHIRADELMCELLTSLGYKEGVDIFDKMSKWYS